ncbi:KPN_02809 family neutral zinc metallopeptidase [Nocardioides sp. SYSU DS0651]|uniref:KPN_02809 family neutral zinc metallopeptidase n=1 Tax=Nocardioides sp. SYSU DS0651 TaxID=3415955 RepID=UPI003F4BC359
MVRFNPKARLDTSRMRSGRGGFSGGLGGRGRGARLPVPGGRGGVGGIAGIILVVLVYVLVQCVAGGGGGGLGTSGYSPARMSDASDDGRYDACRTGADANASQDCARVAIENSLTDFWSDQPIERWQPISALTTFSGSVSTGCGNATSAVGPFYCPADLGIYLDTTFFDTTLEPELGAPDEPFVEFYVLAHEYGHHISNLQGFMGRVRTQQGPTSDATRLELQADCYAGLWAQHATTTEDAHGEVLLEALTDEDIRNALQAAAAVGDDHIQRKTQGQTNPETWNHGSSAQRMHWFRVGFEGGDVADCNTFDASEAEVLGRA